MSKAYDKYLEDHINAVKQAAHWIYQHCDKKKLGEIIPTAFHWEKGKGRYPLFVNHDSSKYSEAEYKAYDDYFYGPDGIKDRGECIGAWASLNYHGLKPLFKFVLTRYERFQ